jgi:hypothetical protein
MILRIHSLAWSAAILGLALVAPAATAALKAGDKAPDATVKDLAGKAVRISQLRGSSPTVVNFFATY